MFEFTSRHTTRTRVKALSLFAPVLGGGIASQARVAAQSDEPVTLSIWLFEGEERTAPALAEAYEAENPNVTVEITRIPQDQYGVRIDTALAAGSPPDIGFLYVDRWAKAGALVPLDDLLAERDIDLANYNQAVMQGSCIIEDQVYCVGTHIGASVLFYNREMFDAAGLEYPSATEPITVDEYAELAMQLSVFDDDISNRVWGGSAGAPYWWMDRTTMVSEDGRQTVGFVNDEPTKHAYEVLSNMVREEYAPNASVSQALGAEGDRALFLQRYLAMAIMDFADLNALDEAGLDFGVAALPVEQAGASPYLPVWSNEMTVFSESENREQALDFIAFIATEGQRVQMEATGAPPLSSAAAEEFGWIEQGANPDVRADFQAVIGEAVPPLFAPDFLGVMRSLGDAFALIVEGEASASDALDEAAPRLQESLDRNWETWDNIGAD